MLQVVGAGETSGMVKQGNALSQGDAQKCTKHRWSKETWQASSVTGVLLEENREGGWRMARRRRCEGAA